VLDEASFDGAAKGDPALPSDAGHLPVGVGDGEKDREQRHVGPTEVTALVAPGGSEAARKIRAHL